MTTDADRNRHREFMAGFADAPPPTSWVDVAFEAGVVLFVVAVLCVLSFGLGYEWALR